MLSISEIYEKYIECGYQVSTDSRNIIPNSLFICLKGQSFDGNRFASESLEKGAKFVITEDTSLQSDKVILVEDSNQALPDLAVFHAKQIPTKLIAIGGSNGKTTTDATAGGLLKGKPHYDDAGNPTGGIPGVVDGQKPIETEGEEFVVNAEASKKHWKELSKINQQDGNGVPIGPPVSDYDDDPAEEFENGGKIQFNPNYLPSKWIMSYAKKIKSKHPEIWKLGGNIFGNEAFENLKRVSERGYWLDSEEWMYIKWRSYVARHKQDFRIEGVVAMLKWVDKVDKGWAYMKSLIQEEIEKRQQKNTSSNSSKSEIARPNIKSDYSYKAPKK